MTDATVTSIEADSQTATALLRRAANEESAAWLALDDTYRLRVERWAGRFGVLPDAGADIAQEVLLAVARKLKDFRHNGRRRAFRQWLLTITRHKILDFWSRNQRSVLRVVGGSDNQVSLLALPDNLESETASQSELAVSPFHNLLQAIRAECTETQWDVFLRLVVDDAEPAEVASEFGITINTVYLTKSRIKRRIRELWGEGLSERDLGQSQGGRHGGTQEDADGGTMSVDSKDAAI